MLLLYLLSNVHHFRSLARGNYVYCVKKIHLFANKCKPMNVKMPSLSPTMSAGTIVKWFKSEGDSVKPGDVLCDIQTDKAVMSFEFEETGILAKVVKPDGSSEVPVGELIALIAEEDEDWRSVQTSSTVPPAPGKSVPALTEATKPVTKLVSNTMRRVGPAARLLLHQHNLMSTVESIPTSGPSGTLLKSDVLDYLSQPVGTSLNLQQVDSSLSTSSCISKPKIISLDSRTATHFDHSLSDTYISWAKEQLFLKQTVPHYYCSVSCRIPIYVFVNNISFGAVVIKAVSQALQQCPELKQFSGHIGWLIHSSENVASVTTLSRVDSIGINDIDKMLHSIMNRRGLTETYSGSTSGVVVSDLSRTVVSSCSLVLPKGTHAAVTICQGVESNKVTISLSGDARLLSEHAASQLLSDIVSAVENPFLLPVATVTDVNSLSEKKPSTPPFSSDLLGIGLDD